MGFGVIYSVSKVKENKERVANYQKRVLQDFDNIVGTPWLVGEILG